MMYLLGANNCTFESPDLTCNGLIQVSNCLVESSFSRLDRHLCHTLFTTETPCWYIFFAFGRETLYKRIYIETHKNH